MPVGGRFFAIIAFFVILGVAMVFLATQSTSSSIVSPSNLLSSPIDQSRIRVGGRITDDPVDYSVQPNFVLKFTIRDPLHPEARVPVIYEGIKPDMFASGRDVLIDGEFRDGVVKAASLQTQCPSKYEPPDPLQGDRAPR